MDAIGPEVHLPYIRMPRGGADSPVLPVELWGHVASFLSLRESCMLASTCRALWAMKLLSLTEKGYERSLSAPGGATSALSLQLLSMACDAGQHKTTRRKFSACAELAWAAKRWSRARLLKIHILQGIAKELSQSLVCSKTNNLACIEELHVYTELSGHSTCTAACSKLLTQAHNVQVAFAEVPSLDGFFCARGIKHLALLIANPHCGIISSAMSGLEQLETLWLGDQGREAEVSGILQLSALQSLRSLMLSSIVPESISCNDSCELHLELNVDSTEHAVWETVLPSLHSVSLCGNTRELVVLPSILLKAGKLLKAAVRVQQCGTASAPLLLGGSLAHVEELVLECGELHAVVPAGVTWQNVYMAATHLNLRFETVAPFGEAIPAFCFRFNKVQGTAILELAAVVAKRLPQWTGALEVNNSLCWEQPLTSGICFPLAQPL